MRYLIRVYENGICIKAEYKKYTNTVEVTNSYEYDIETQTIKITTADNGNRDD